MAGLREFLDRATVMKLATLKTAGDGTSGLGIPSIGERPVRMHD
jgi:hypothetical protein